MQLKIQYLMDYAKLHLLEVMEVEEFLSIPEKNVVYEVPDDDQSLVNL